MRKYLALKAPPKCRFTKVYKRPIYKQNKYAVRSVGALDRRTVCSIALNYSEFPQCSNESYGARATQITRAYVECVRLQLLGSHAVALDHWLVVYNRKCAQSLVSWARSQVRSIIGFLPTITGALDRRIRALERTNRGQFGSFAPFHHLNHILMPMTCNTIKP